MTNFRPRPRCGTRGGYDSHRYYGEDACDACKDANRAYQRDYQRITRPTRAKVTPHTDPMPETREVELPCRTQGADNWFSKGRVRTNTAKLWCDTCPLEAACLAYALQYDLAGVWGGTTHGARKKIQKAAGIKPVSITAEVSAA